MPDQRRGLGRSVYLALVLLVAASVFVALRLEVTTDISRFFPSGADRQKARASHALASSESSRTLMITIETDDTASAVAASRAYEQELRADEALMERLRFIEGGPPEGIDETLWELYQPRRLSFAARDAVGAEALVADEGLHDAATEIRRRLATPLSTLVTRTAPEDPFLSVPRLFERMQRGRTDALAAIDGRFVADERFAAFLIGTNASAFDASAQKQVRAGLEAAYARVAERMQVGPLQSSGVARFSIVAEDTIKADIRRTSIVSLVGLFALCLIVLRSFRLVVLTTIPIGCAMVAATAVSLILYGEVHGLTFAFGASLIGVCVDYVVHLYVHHTQHPDPEGPRGTLRRIWPALLLGAGTTAVGFAVMAGSSFPGLRQVAIFASVGVVAALLATRVLLPPLLPRTPKRARLRDRLVDVLAARFHRLQRTRAIGWTLVTAAVVATVWGSLDVRWTDDLAEMNRLDPALIEEDERVRDRIARFDQGRFVVALADTEEAALQINDAVDDALREATAAGELQAWQGIATLLPSAARQRRVDETIRTAPELEQRLRRVLAEEGFNEQMFSPFFEHLDQPAPEPLVFADLERSAAAALVRSLKVDIDGRIGFVSLLRGVDDPEALDRRMAAIDGAIYIDQAALMGSAMHAYTMRTIQLLGVGLLAVLAVLGWRYRSALVAAAVIAPAVLAAGVTMAVLAAIDRPLDIIGLTAVLMILSIGVDYGVFLAETHDEDEGALPATLLALVVCWASTVLGFGVLALSQHPTMNTIGIVAAVGVTASLLLAPTTLALLPADRRARP